MSSRTRAAPILRQFSVSHIAAAAFFALKCISEICSILQPALCFNSIHDGQNAFPLQSFHQPPKSYPNDVDMN